MDSLYKILTRIYSDYSAQRLEHELNRIEFLDEYNIATRAYTSAEIRSAFEKLITEKQEVENGKQRTL